MAWVQRSTHKSEHMSSWRDFSDIAMFKVFFCLTALVDYGSDKKHLYITLSACPAMQWSQQKVNVIVKSLEIGHAPVYEMILWKHSSEISSYFFK